MKRDLAGMAAKRHDLLVIGGGVSGAAIAHEAALRGLSVALVEKGDFGAGTSAATSKLIHGGLRYLRQFDFKLVKESLRERHTMTRIAPHLVAPVAFLMPTYRGLEAGRTAMHAAMFLYHRFADPADGGTDDVSRRFPTWRSLGRDEVLTMQDHLRTDGLNGGVMYYDGQMWSPERLTLEFIAAAVENGGRVANYAAVASLLREKNTVAGARVKDVFTGEEFDVQALMTINAGGPWADYVTSHLEGAHQQHIVRSQGIHLVTRALTYRHGLALRTPSGRFFFVVPWRGLSLIGTTDTRYEGHPDDFRVTRDAVESFLAEVNGTLPGAHLTIDDVQWTYGGLRPIVESDTAVKEVNKASRRYEIHDHKTEDGIAGLMTVIGGKYTTSRALAEQVVERAAIRMNLPVPARASAAYVLPGGRIGTWAGLQTRLMREFDISADDAELWGRTYGTRAIALAEKASADKKSGERVDPAHIETMAVLDMAVDEEMAQTVGDVVFRRTGLGTTGVLSEAAIKSIASRMGKRLKWSKERVADETRSVSEKLRSRGISPS